VAPIEGKIFTAAAAAKKWHGNKEITFIKDSEEIENPGNYLLIADQRLSVTTPFGAVKLSKGAVAFISWTAADLSIYNLAESTPNSVVVIAGINKVSLYVGRQAVICGARNVDFQSANRLGQIAWKQAKRQRSGEHSIFTADFSIISALQNISPLKDLISSDHHAARHLVDRIIKIALLLHQNQTGDIVVPEPNAHEAVASAKGSVNLALNSP
jgi:hypothetical protein